MRVLYNKTCIINLASRKTYSAHCGPDDANRNNPANFSTFSLEKKCTVENEVLLFLTPV
jgi:hypothetical protein